MCGHLFQSLRPRAEMGKKFGVTTNLICATCCKSMMRAPGGWGPNDPPAPGSHETASCSCRWMNTWHISGWWLRHEMFSRRDEPPAPRRAPLQVQAHARVGVAPQPLLLARFVGRRAAGTRPRPSRRTGAGRRETRGVHAVTVAHDTASGTYAPDHLRFNSSMRHTNSHNRLFTVIYKNSSIIIPRPKPLFWPR
jgi:hypothetical protein